MVLGSPLLNHREGNSLRFSLRVTSRGIIWGGIAVLALLMAANGFVSYEAVRRLIWNTQWVGHTRAVESGLVRLELLLVNAETGQRGYLITGREEYLKPYASAVQQLPDGFAHVRSLLSDNPEQLARLRQIENTSRNKLDEIAQTISLQKGGQRVAALALVDSNIGKLEMDQIHATILQMKTEEARLLAFRTEKSQTGQLLAYGTLGLSSAIAFLAVLAFGVVLARAERSRNEAAAIVREREQWLSTTLASIGDAVIVTGSGGKVRFLNPVAQRLLQWTEAAALGSPIAEVLPIVDESTGEPIPLPSGAVGTGNGEGILLRQPDGSQIPVAVNAAPIRARDGSVTGTVLVLHDLSEQRRTERALRVSEKLAATGRLAATVAHEVNNPLEAVTNILYLLAGDPGLTPKGRELLSAAEEQLERVAHITRQTLSFYRSTSQQEPLNVAAIFDRVLEVYREKIAAKRVHIEKDYDTGLLVLATSGELTQAISNLVSNALDAVAADGTISLAVFAGANQNVFITVQDDGCGIKPEALDQVFEPFFTTKKDVGTGLGLWVTREIIEKLGGRVSASSDGIGQGAQFALSLPICQQEHDQSSQVSIA